MTPVLAAACEKAVHVVQSNGTCLRAGRAVLLVLEELGYKAVARVLLLPPLIWFVEAGYILVANHRDFFATFLFTRDHSAEAPEAVPGDKLSYEDQ